MTWSKTASPETAFKAEMAGKGPGPTVTIMLEYDALANGHSCGHNLIATSGLLAAAGLAKVMKDTPGRVFVIGTPDEERGSLGAARWRCSKAGISRARTSFSSPIRPTAGVWSSGCWR